MTQKFRIYDKEKNKYVKEHDCIWMLSRNGKLYNSENDEWHDIGVRYVVEMDIKACCAGGYRIYEGDVLETNESGCIGFVKYDHSANIIMDSSGGYSAHPDFSNCKIIGTIHDEKYKNL